MPNTWTKRKIRPIHLDNGNELLLLIDIRRYDENVDLLALLTVITIYCHRNPFN